MAGPIRIAILSDFKSKGVDDARSSVQKLGDGFRNMAAPAAAVVAGLGLVAKATIDMASDSEQSLGASQTVFGKYADSVIRRSKEADTALGLNQNAYRELANSLGASLSNAGVSADKLAGQTDTLITRASDMAATFGGTTVEAVEAVSSALRGESDPIEKYGVSLNESTVNARLAAEGQDKLTGSALAQAKMAARQAIIMEQTKGVMGQFGREADTAAGAVERNRAKFENLQITLGEKLLPIWVRLQEVASAALSFITANIGPVTVLATVLGGMAAAILVVNGAMAAWRAATVVATAAQWLFNTALFASPITWIVLGIAAVVAGLVLFFTKTRVGQRIWAGFTEFLKSALDNTVSFFKRAWQWIQNAISNVFNWVKRNWPLLVGILTGPIGIAVSLLIRNWDKIWAGAKALWGRLSGFFRGLPGAIRGALGNLGSTLWNAGVAIVQGFYNGLVAKFNAVKSFVSSIGSWIASHKGPRSYDLRLLVPAGGWIMEGLSDGLKREIPELERTLGTVAGVVSGSDMGALSLRSAASASSLTVSSGSGSSAPAQVVLTYEPTGDKLIDVLLETLRKGIRVNGGNVQAVLGP